MPRSTVSTVRSAINEKYARVFNEQQAKRNQACSFRPDLSGTQIFNKSVSPSVSFNNTQNMTPREVQESSFYLKNQEWDNKRQQKILVKQEKKEIEDLKGLTFRPEIKTMVSERAMVEQNLDENNIKRSTVNTIPLDSAKSRQAFTCVPGMAKYLEKQFQAMKKKESTKLAMQNLGREKSQKKTLDEVIKPDFAYR